MTSQRKSARRARLTNDLRRGRRIVGESETQIVVRSLAGDRVMLTMIGKEHGTESRASMSLTAGDVSLLITRLTNIRDAQLRKAAKCT